MLLTETEARDRWCPHARVIYGGPTFNRLGELSTANPTELNPEICRCIASACMAWRWGEWALTDVRTTTEDGRPMVVQVDDRSQPTRGYCGLAGRP